LQWSPNLTSSIATLPTNSCTYSTAFSPHSPSILSSVSSDSTLRVFDLRTPSSAANHLVASVPIHSTASIGSSHKAFEPSEALTHDWNKYRSNVIATAGVDRIIRTFDLRNTGFGPIALLHGHEYAIRRLAWSPHLSDVLLSASYDMTCRVWSDGSALGVNGGVQRWGVTANGDVARELGRMTKHTEFVTGVDWCLFGVEGWCASCGWDEKLCVWDAKTVIR
jgi:peroxin-7